MGMTSCGEYGLDDDGRQSEESSKEIRELELQEFDGFMEDLSHIKTVTDRATIENTIKEQKRLIKEQRARKREASEEARKQMQYRESKGRKFQGNLGEHAAAQLVLNKMGYADTGFIQPYHGIDGIGRKGDRYVVVEAKATVEGDGSKGLGEQGSKNWVDKQLGKMQDRNSAQSKGHNHRIARELSKAMREGKVERLVIHINTSTLNAIAFQGQESGAWSPRAMWNLVDS